MVLPLRFLRKSQQGKICKKEWEGKKNKGKLCNRVLQEGLGKNPQGIHGNRDRNRCLHCLHRTQLGRRNMKDCLRHLLRFLIQPTLEGREERAELWSECGCVLQEVAASETIPRLTERMLQVICPSRSYDGIAIVNDRLEPDLPCPLSSNVGPQSARK